MPGGFSNKPKILRGAFVEYGLSLPPLFVVFQFNPVQLTRNRSISYQPPNDRVPCPTPAAPPSTTTTERGGTSTPQTQPQTQPRWSSLRDYHNTKDLDDIQSEQQVTLQEEAIGFEIRLDATDKLNDGDPITQQFGIAPQLAALEMMVHPKEENLLAQALTSLPGSSGGFNFTGKDNPPMILFIWGLKRVLPVNIKSLNITETEFNTKLDPVRATVSVNLEVIEGNNALYTYSKIWKEVMAAVNLANIADIANVVIPG